MYGRRDPRLYVPAGEDEATIDYAQSLLQRGLVEKFEPKIAVAVHTRDPNFFMEVGIAVGGPTLRHGVHPFRLLQRLPLLYEEGIDVETNEILEKIVWKEYKIDPERERVAIFVNIQTKGDVTIHFFLERLILDCCAFLKDMKREPRKEQEACIESIRSFDPKNFRFPDPSEPFFHLTDNVILNQEGILEIAKAYRHASAMGIKFHHYPLDKLIAMLEPYKSSPAPESEVEALRCSFDDKVTTECGGNSEEMLKLCLGGLQCEGAFRAVNKV